MLAGIGAIRVINWIATRGSDMMAVHSASRRYATMMVSFRVVYMRDNANVQVW